jgi:hypothetical protein
MKSTIFPVILMILLSSASCDSPLSVERDADAAIQTDRLEYTLREAGSGFEVEIPYSFTNTTGSKVYLVNCNQYVEALLELKAFDGWVVGWAPALEDCLSPPIIIEPGEVFQDTIRVHAARFGSNTYPQFQSADPEGVYRIRWENALTSFDADQYPFGEPLPLDGRVSNRFVLKNP